MRSRKKRHFYQSNFDNRSWDEQKKYKKKIIDETLGPKQTLGSLQTMIAAWHRLVKQICFECKIIFNLIILNFNFSGPGAACVSEEDANSSWWFPEKRNTAHNTRSDTSLQIPEATFFQKHRCIQEFCEISS